MAVHEITEDRFNTLFDARNPIIPTKEYAWFATENEQMLGAVVYDNSDNDWAYIILERDEDKAFRWVAGNTSISSQEKATVELKKSMNDRQWNAPD